MPAALIRYWELPVLVLTLVVFSKKRMWAAGCIPVFVLSFTTVMAKSLYDEWYSLVVQIPYMFAFIYLTMMDIRKKREQSVFVKYSPFNENSVLPRKVKIALCVLAFLVSVIQLIILLTGKR